MARPALFASTPLALQTGSSAATPAGSSGSGMKRRPESDVLLIAKKMLQVAPSKRSSVLNARNRDGDTMLHASCRAGHLAVVRLLLAEGCPELDIDATTEGGFSALGYASRGGWSAIVAALVAAGADTKALTGPEAHRFIAIAQEKRPLVHEAFTLGAKAYAKELQQTLLHGCAEPFARMPDVLSAMIIEYVLGPEAAAPLVASASLNNKH